MISHEYRMIFIHIPKTGGTSIEKMFGALKTKKITFEKSKKQVDIMPFKVEKHYDASDVEVQYKNFIESYFKWTIVRNPWEREYSFYNMVNGRRKNKKTFLEYLKTTKINKKDKVLQDQINFIFNKKNQKPIVDKIVRYENLANDWKNICQIIKKPFEEMIHINKGEYEEEISKAYNQECVDFVAELRKKDIEYLKYDLPKI